MNIPMFRLWVWDSSPQNGAPSFGMDVIVGRGLNRQTPIFVEEMEYLIFRPYWNVPRRSSGARFSLRSAGSLTTCNDTTWRSFPELATMLGPFPSRRKAWRNSSREGSACDSAQDRKTHLDW